MKVNILVSFGDCRVCCFRSLLVYAISCVVMLYEAHTIHTSLLFSFIFFFLFFIFRDSNKPKRYWKTHHIHYYTSSHFCDIDTSRYDRRKEKKKNNAFRQVQETKDRIAYQTTTTTTTAPASAAAAASAKATADGKLH